MARQPADTLAGWIALAAAQPAGIASTVEPALFHAIVLREPADALAGWIALATAQPADIASTVEPLRPRALAAI